MWIWVLARSSAGNLTKIVAKAKHYGVRTLLVKSSDGSSTWSQFSSRLVSMLHANGLRVCAWQYVYGNLPDAEARVGAAAVRKGADCLVIDAESEYEGRYVQAQRYVSLLRSLIGSRFPVALAGFPYIDYHPAFPYSEFLGPQGAQYNVPQMYWKDIGTTVDAVYAHTYMFNRLYGRAIYPLGQIYNAPPARQVVHFRQVGTAYGAGAVSWWDWQEASGAGWHAIGQRVARLAGYTPSAQIAGVASKARGDLVVWAQEHLVSAGQHIPVDGVFGSRTRRAVRNFQAAKALPVTGRIDARTWRALLRYSPAHVHWSLHSRRAADGASTATAVPRSASLPPVRDEIAGAGGRGG
jgi:hypothetical protein